MTLKLQTLRNLPDERRIDALILLLSVQFSTKQRLSGLRIHLVLFLRPYRPNSSLMPPFLLIVLDTVTPPVRQGKYQITPPVGQGKY